MSIQEQKITEAAIAANGVQSRPDKLTGTAAQNKKVFDNLVTAVVREKFNALLDELTGAAAAAQLGITTIPGFSADNVQAMLEQIVTAMQEITQGSVADGSITLAKLAAEVTAAALGGAPASHTHGAGDISSGVLNADRIPVLDGTKLGAGSVGTAQLGAAAVTAEKLAALAVLATHIAQGAVTAQKIAPGAVTAEKIAEGAITPASIGALPLTGGTINGPLKNTADVQTQYLAQRGGPVCFRAQNSETGAYVDLFASQIAAGVTVNGAWLIYRNGEKVIIDGSDYRSIYIGTSDTPPSSWKPGDIYLQYT